MGDRNVLGGELEPCGTDPVTGFYRDGCCNTGPEDRGSHTICVVVTAEFLEHQRRIGNDLSTPVPQYRFPGLVPGDRWCVTAANWLRAHQDGVGAPGGYRPRPMSGPSRSSRSPHSSSIRWTSPLTRARWKKKNRAGEFRPARWSEETWRSQGVPACPDARTPEGWANAPRRDSDKGGVQPRASGNLQNDR